MFYPRYAWEILSKHARLLILALRYRWICWRVDRDPKAAGYRDLALTAVTEGETEDLEIFSATESAKQAVEKAKRLKLPRPVPAAAS